MCLEMIRHFFHKNSIKMNKKATQQCKIKLISNHGYATINLYKSTNHLTSSRGIVIY